MASARGLGIDGLISGIDTTTLIETLMVYERMPLTQAQEKQTTLQRKADAWRDVNTRLYNLQQKVYNLKSSLTFKSQKVIMGSEEYFTASASTGAPNASYQVEVVNLARAHTVASKTLEAANTSLGYTGKFQINGKEIEVTATDTLNSIASKINSTADVGVNAAIVKIADGEYRMTLTSKQTGAANAIQVTDDDGILANLGFLDDSGEFANLIQEAADATIKVNGLTVNRASNTIDDVIPGVKLTLKKAGSTNISVERDLDKIITAVKEFVDQYNSTMSFINESMAYNKETKEKGVLLGESTLLYLQSELRSILTRTVSSNPTKYNSLTMIGISTGAYNQSIEATKSGNLVLDESKLRTALEENFDAVAQLFGAKITNVASADNGATITTSSQYSEMYPATSLIDGRTTSDDWGNGGGWMDNTAGAYPDWVEISFNGRKTIDSLNIYTLNRDDMKADTYGVRDLSFEYWDEATSSWKPLKSAADPSKDLVVEGNTKGVINLDFQAVTTTKVRININSSNEDNDYSRLTEIEVLQKNDGIFSNMYSKLWDITRSGGLTDSKIDSIKEQQKKLDQRIEYLEELMKKKEEYYRARFTALESALSQIQSQTAYLNAQLASLSFGKKS